ncbi:MAG: nitrogenase component 1, partial [Anaerolineae bacterium]
ADATFGLPLVRMLAEDLEIIPRLVALRSGQVGTAELLTAELADLGLNPEVILPCDVFRAREAVKRTPVDMLFGSNIERHAEAGLNVPFIFRVVAPLAQSRMTDRAYFGYTGMLNIIEAIQNDYIERYRSKTLRYQARW